MNIRELEKLTRRLAMLTEPDELLELVDLPEALQDRVRARTITAPTPAPGPTLADQAIPYRSDLPEREELETILRATSGNILRTAERLYRKRTQIYRAIERYGLDLQLYRGTN
jgi:transcriptional regulator of acetoin/glycerol metabolism